MKKPDRFEQLVGKHRHIARDGMGYILLEETAHHLMRLQHLAYVRLVGKLRHAGKVRTAYQGNREAKCAVISAYTLACDDLLAALARYRKGGK
jgi:hypothetical protein